MDRIMLEENLTQSLVTCDMTDVIISLDKFDIRHDLEDVELFNWEEELNMTFRLTEDEKLINLAEYWGIE